MTLIPNLNSIEAFFFYALSFMSSLGKGVTNTSKSKQKQNFSQAKVQLKIGAEKSN